MYNELLIDFDGKKIKLQEIRCSNLPQFKNYVWYQNENKKSNGKEYFIVGERFDEKLTNDGRIFTDAMPLRDVIKVGEYVYKNFKKDNNNFPIFLRNDREAMNLSQNIINTICKKYGIPQTKKNHFEIYDFAFFCYDLYIRFSTWLLLYSEDEIEEIKSFLGKNASHLRTKNDIKAHIVPCQVWDYDESSITVHFSYNKETDKYIKYYNCKNLKELALLQFNLLFFSKDGIMFANGSFIKVKQCECCNTYFVTSTTQKRYCDNCKKIRQAERKRKSRKNKTT